jgi:predicted  nucleic acid-binding Zn-ribbon protein
MGDHDVDEAAGSSRAGVARKRREGGDQPPEINEVTNAMDALSLEQALKDVDIANGRVVDLTQRLIAAQGQIADLQTALAQLEVKAADQRARYQRVTKSHAYRLAQRYWAILGAWRGLE